MASRSTHPVGKPAGLSPADLQRHAKPAAYLTGASNRRCTGQWCSAVCSGRGVIDRLGRYRDQEGLL
jgi:hypothetical protein